MKRTCTGTVLSRKSYVKTSRNALTHEASILGAKVYNTKMSGKKNLWEKLREGKKVVS